jgi:hypothetical protein
MNIAMYSMMINTNSNDIGATNEAASNTGGIANARNAIGMLSSNLVMASDNFETATSGGNGPFMTWKDMVQTKSFVGTASAAATAE